MILNFKKTSDLFEKRAYIRYSKTKCINVSRSNLLYILPRLVFVSTNYMCIQSDFFSYFTPRITFEAINLIDRRNESGEHCETSSPSNTNGIWF